MVSAVGVDLALPGHLRAVRLWASVSPLLPQFPPTQWVLVLPLPPRLAVNISAGLLHSTSAAGRGHLSAAAPSR